MKKKVVCFGGGNAMPKAILEPLMKQSVDIISITSMVDNGGSTGQLRKDFGVLPAGDIRRHIFSLSQAPQWKKNLWNFRFGREKFNGGHKGHNFANVFIAGIENSLNNYQKTLEIIQDFMEVNGKVLPATIKQVQLCAELENGEIIEGENEIDVPQQHNANLKIKKVFLDKETEAYPFSLKAITEADLIIIGPGDLYSSILPCFLMKGMRDAFRRTNAKKIFICNTMTKFGETNDFSVLNFADEIEKYLGCSLNFVVYNKEIPTQERIRKYQKEELGILELVRVDKDLDNKKFIATTILKKDGLIIYEPEKLIELIMLLN